MSSNSIAKINQAVDACLECCAGSSVLSVLHDFLKELEDSGNWTPDEIKTVERAATRALKTSL